MKIRFISITIVAGLFTLFVPFAGSNQADDTTIRINGYTPGVTPFISNLSLTASKYGCSEEHPVHESLESQAPSPDPLIRHEDFC
jgi:hypothetical protein